MGNYVSQLIDDADRIYRQSFGALFSGIENPAATVFSLAALFLLSRHIGLASVILLAVISVLPRLAGKRLQKENAFLL